MTLMANKRTRSVLLALSATAVVVLAVLLGGAVVYFNHRLKGAPQVEISQLNGHCGQLVAVTGAADTAGTARPSYRIRDSASSPVSSGVAQVAIIVDKGRKDASLPSQGELVVVRGSVVCQAHPDDVNPVALPTVIGIMELARSPYKQR